LTLFAKPVEVTLHYHWWQ